MYQLQVSLVTFGIMKKILKLNIQTQVSLYVYSCETSVNQVIFDNFVPLVIDAKYFEEYTGHAPINDDLECVNCNEIGLGHYHCGWNHKLKPHFN